MRDCMKIERVSMWIELASTAEAATVRVFAGKLAKGDTRKAATERVIESLGTCCRVAEKAGVVLALENHGGLTETPADLLTLVKPIASKALAINVDTGNFTTKDPYADIAAIVPYGVVCQVKTECFRAGKPAEEANLKKVVEILRAGQFRGCVILEYEAKEDPKTAVPKYLKELHKLIG